MSICRLIVCGIVDTEAREFRLGLVPSGWEPLKDS